jgi:ABC transporter substrate binding protein
MAPLARLTHPTSGGGQRGGAATDRPTVRFRCDLTRRAAAFVVKVINGVTPADLPIEQPTNFELVIILKTAKALGILVPASLLARADEVIE